MSTLNENILKVKETFQDIAAAIEEKGVDVGECDSPVTYADKIRSISGSAEGGFDIDKLYVEAYETDAPEPSASVSPTDDGGVMITFGLRRGATGPQGPQGPQGPAGNDGESGTDGKDGVDGSTYEYVYFRGLTLEDKPIDIPSGEGNTSPDYKPTYTKTVTVDGNTVVLKWEDRAQGVDETYKYEWRSERKKKDTTTWEDFTSPILWAKYGEKGKDGDGVQYIFTTTKTSKAPSHPYPTGWETDPLYQNNEIEEYIPAPEDGQVWKDDPIEVDDVNQFCWVSVRKYRNGKWGRYSDPTLWTKWTDSSGTVVSDTIVIDLDPDWAMVNKDLPVAKTDVTARRGNDPIIIQDITCDEGGFKFFADKLDKDGITWRVTVSEIDLEADIIPVRLHIKLSETQSWTKTFTIYPTSLDNETISADFGDDNILVPCSDGETPDADFFTNLEVPILMRVGGKEVTATSATPDKYDECFELTTNGNLKVKKYPGTNQRESIKFTISDGVNPTTAYLNFTKFNTAGGTISMYTLNINANDIVCDTRSGQNVYTVYTGKQSSTDNVIKASINVYSTNGNTIIPVSELPSNYAVFYANDPQDWIEDASSTIGEYQKITDDGIKIGETISPDQCVAFQLREWIGNGEPWSDMSETNYKIWDNEIISVDIIQDIAAYKFVLTPNKIHRNVENEIVVPNNQEIAVGLSKDVAGDGDPQYTQLNEIPTGYDIYYEIDNSGNIQKIGGEPESVSLPYSLDVSSVTNSIIFYLIKTKSTDDGEVVLSETISVTSDVPGESAYVGYLTDSLGIVSCDANGEPTAGTVLSTEFKVTNGTVTNVTSNYEGSDFKVTPSGSTITFDEFKQTLPEKTTIVLTASYLDKDGVVGTETAVYTIVKLKVAEASTILDFSNDNVVIPCDENDNPYVTEVTTFVAMLHGDEILTLTSEDVTLGEQNEEGYYKLTIPIDKLSFDGVVCNKKLTFTGTGKTGSWTRMGQLILTKLKAGESGQIWDLVLTADTPKYNNDTDKFDDDYVEGWVNIWGADDWRVATSNDLANAGRYIVYKANEEGESYQPLTVGEDGKFKVYINAIDNDNETYVNIDETNGLKIALAKLENGLYVPIQEETIKASYDGRDFGKFELMLSDSAIYQTYKDNEQVTVTPNEVKIIGVYEYDGPKRFDYTDGEIHVKHVSGLDIYYSIDHLCSEYDADHMVSVTDKDGWLTNDVIPVNLNDIKDRLDVYLIAHYDNPDIEGNETTLTIVDHKHLKVVPVTLPDDVYLYHMELDQDEVKVPIDENGNVDSEFTVSVTPYFYKNDDIQNEKFLYAFGYDELPSDGWSEIKTFVASDFDNNYSYIWFKATSQALYKKCKITKELNPVEIFINRNVVKREISDNKVHDAITLEAKKWNYDSNTWDAVTVSSVVMKYTTLSDSNERSTIISASDDKYVIDLNNDSYKDINYIRFEVTHNNKTSFEEVGVITDGMDGSAREVLYYKSTGNSDVPYNPTPLNIESGSLYQMYELPSDWVDEGEDSYTNKDNDIISKIIAAKWVDNYPGVNDNDCKIVYACERKKKHGISLWEEFSNPQIYAIYVEDGTPGESAWSWRLTDPIEMVSYNSDGTLNGTLNSTTTVLANYGGNIATAEITNISKIEGCTVTASGDTATLTGLPDGTNIQNFNFTITAKGTYIDADDKTHTATADLIYTVKKWFGEAPTAMVHLSNNSTPVPTDSEGVYPEDVIRTAELTASSGTNPIAITNVTCNLNNVTTSLDGSELTITVKTDADWSGSDVLAVPIICTLDGDYPDQTVTMNFYKVRATGKAEYPDVYDLFVSPNSIFVEVDQTTGMGVYKSNTITPTIRKYGADNSTTDLSVEDFDKLEIGQLSYDFDGDNAWKDLKVNSFDVNNNTNDADEYIDVKLEIGDWKQIERVKVSHGQIPNIDWELVLECPERIPYDYEGNIKITAPTIACKLCKNVNGTLTNVDECPANFDIVYELDGARQENNYELGNTITLDSFNRTCEFILVNQGDENNEQDEVYDRKLVTKEYDAEPGKSGSTPIIYPAGDFDIAKATKGEYVGNSNQAPYVYYNVESDLKGFYIAYGTPKAAPSDDNIIKKDEEVNWMNIPDNAANWIEMNNFSAIYSDIGVLQHALVGKWVFHGDYMFSQDGHLGNPESGSFAIAGAPGGNKYNGDECSYDLVVQRGISFGQIPDQENGIKKWPLYQHVEFGSWVPNIWFNAKTGAGKLGDAMIFDEQGVTTILKNPVFKKESVIFEGEPLRMSSLHNNTNYVFSATSKFEFNQHVIIGESSDERFSINEDVVVQFTNNTDVPIDLHFVNIHSWETLHASTNDDNELEEYINIVFKQDPLWTLNAPGIEDGGSGFNQRTDTLLLYPGKSIELNIFAEKPGINYIITKTPLWSTIWDGDLVACNIPSFIPYGKIIGTGECKHFDPFSPVVTIQDCNFNMMRFIDNWVDELVLFKIFDSNGDYLSNIVISDKNEWFKVPVPKGGTVSIYYSNKDIFSNECAVIARMLFATESMFGGSNYLQYAKGDFNVQEGFEIANKITYTRYNGWYAFDLKIPDTTMKLTVKGVEPYSNHKLFREVTLKFVRSNIKFSFQDPDNFDYDYEDYAAFSVTCIMGDATEGYKRLSYDAPMRKPEDGFWKFNGDFWDVDYRENMDFVLYPNNNSVGSVSESVQILLNPRYVMNGLDRDRSIVWIITATLKDGSEKDVKIKLTLNDKVWSSTDKFITLI